MKRSLIFLAVIFGLLPLPVVAEGEEATPTPEETTEEAAEEMEDALSLNAKSAVLLDENSGQVLYEYQKDTEWDPASLTKLMTIYLSIDTLGEGKELTMSDSAFETYNHSSGVLWIQQGETLKSEDCFYASMLASANDTTAMLAEAAGVSVDGMVDRMNTKAQELEMSHTHFDNVFGTNSESNYSSAYDLALFLKEARKNATFKEVFGASSYTIEPTNYQSQQRVLANDCQLLRQSSAYYNASVTGGKIGNTEEGGYALAISASKGDTNYIAVVLGEPEEETAYSDVTKLLDYGFESVTTVTVTPEDIGTKTIEVMKGKTHVADVEFYADSSYSLLLTGQVEKSDVGYEIQVVNEDSSDPEEISANVVFTLKGETIGSQELSKTVTEIDNTVTESGQPKSQLYFDITSIVILVFIFFYKGFVRFIDSLRPNH